MGHLLDENIKQKSFEHDAPPGHMWLVSQGNPYVMQETCQCTFLKGFSITNNILAKKKFFIVANFFK